MGMEMSSNASTTNVPTPNGTSPFFLLRTKFGAKPFNHSLLKEHHIDLIWVSSP